MVTYNASAAARGRKPRSFGCLLSALPFFLGALLGGWFAVLPAWHARLDGIQTRGTVISTSICTSDGDALLAPFLAQDSSNSVTALIQFIDTHGQKQIVSENVCGDYTEGQGVILWYLPGDPQTFTTDQQLGDTYWIAGLLVVFSAPFVISLLIIVVRVLSCLFVALLAGGRRASQPQPAFVTPVLQSQPSGAAYNAPTPAYSSPYSPTIPALAPPLLAQPTSKLPYRLGQTAEVDGLCAVTLTRVATSSGDLRSRPAPGYLYLLLGVALRNRSAQPMDAFMAGRFQLADVQGTEYQPALLAGTVFYLTGMIQPGDQQDEQLAFSVPSDIHQFHLTFQRERSSPPLATWEINV
jgi:hypothetical protein